MLKFVSDLKTRGIGGKFLNNLIKAHPYRLRYHTLFPMEGPKRQNFSFNNIPLPYNPLGKNLNINEILNKNIQILPNNLRFTPRIAYKNASNFKTAFIAPTIW